MQRGDGCLRTLERHHDDEEEDNQPEHDAADSGEDDAGAVDGAT